MLVEQFFALYANTPLADRIKMLDINQMGTTNLQDLNARLHALEDLMSPHRIERDRLLSFITDHWIKTGKI